MHYTGTFGGNLFYVRGYTQVAVGRGGAVEASGRCPLKTALLLLSTALALGMYYPLWRRILRRRSTSDFSKAAYWMILSTQAVNGTLAALETAWFLVAIYVFHALFIGATLALVYRFYKGD